MAKTIILKDYGTDQKEKDERALFVLKIIGMAILFSIIYVIVSFIGNFSMETNGIISVIILMAIYIFFRSKQEKNRRKHSRRR